MPQHPADPSAGVGLRGLKVAAHVEISILQGECPGCGARDAFEPEVPPPA